MWVRRVGKATSTSPSMLIWTLSSSWLSPLFFSFLSSFSLLSVSFSQPRGWPAGTSFQLLTTHPLHCARVCVWVRACIVKINHFLVYFCSWFYTKLRCNYHSNDIRFDSEPNHRVDDAYIVGFHTARKTVSSLHCGDVHHTCPLQLKYFTSLDITFSLRVHR